MANDYGDTEGIISLFYLFCMWWYKMYVVILVFSSVFLFFINFFLFLFQNLEGCDHYREQNKGRHYWAVVYLICLEKKVNYTSRLLFYIYQIYTPFKYFKTTTMIRINLQNFRDFRVTRGQSTFKYFK
jgi:ABC-type bacteriocin/lantibiotic exporter with double-glycine peptidase domain